MLFDQWLIWRQAALIYCFPFYVPYYLRVCTSVINFQWVILWMSLHHENFSKIIAPIFSSIIGCSFILFFFSGGHWFKSSLTPSLGSWDHNKLFSFSLCDLSGSLCSCFFSAFRKYFTHLLYAILSLKRWSFSTEVDKWVIDTERIFFWPMNSSIGTSFSHYNGMEVEVVGSRPTEIMCNLLIKKDIERLFLQFGIHLLFCNS